MEQDKGVDCGEDTFVIQAAPQYAEWRVYTNGGAKSHSVADLLVAGQFLMGCEDEFPPLQVLLSNDPMGSLMFGDVATNGNQRAIALATIDTISPAEQFNLSVFYGFSWTWWNALDDVEDEQAYCAGQDA
ncbi:MAG: hypothetical protein GY884_34780 [Proteobacteria bacterium]|nr:hypothetical protein [Pseudomonadota bacterium]